MDDLKNSWIIPTGEVGCFYRVLLHDSDFIIGLDVPQHFLLNVIQIALASDVRVSIPNFVDDCHGNKSVSK